MPSPNAIGNAIGYAKFYSRSHGAVIRVYDEAGNVLEPHEHKGDFSFGFPFIRHQVFLPVVKRHPF
jgi:hypothetical protein